MTNEPSYEKLIEEYNKKQEKRRQNIENAKDPVIEMICIALEELNKNSGNPFSLLGEVLGEEDQVTKCIKGIRKINIRDSKEDD